MLNIRLKKLIKRGKYNFFYKLYRWIKLKRKIYVNREINMKNDEGICDNETVYIIRKKDQTGFFSIFLHVLSHIVYASQKGYKIVVDMENYPTLYNETYKYLDTNNAWEYYFQQPDDISLETANKYKNIIFSSFLPVKEEIPSYMATQQNPITYEMIENLSIYVEKYIKINKTILDEVESQKKQWGENILAVHIRGTDMYNTLNHPIPVSIDMYYKAIDEILKNKKINKIFCCTDEESILQKMKLRYGELIVSTSSLRSTDGKALHTNGNFKRENHKYNLGKEVLIDALLLSSCDYLICGHSSVAYGAIILNKGHFTKTVLIESNGYTEN